MKRKCLRCKKLKAEFIVKNSKVLCLDCLPKYMGNAIVGWIETIWKIVERQ